MFCITSSDHVEKGLISNPQFNQLKSAIQQITPTQNTKGKGVQHKQEGKTSGQDKKTTKKRSNPTKREQEKGTRKPRVQKWGEGSKNKITHRAREG